jgi:hypothetical protein
MKTIAKPRKFLAQPFRVIVPVMQVNLYFTAPTGTQTSQQIDADRVVVFLWVKERLLRAFAVCIG